MKLIIFPGSTDPYKKRNKKSYQILIDEAKNRGFSDVKLITYPGHHSNEIKKSLNSSVAKQVMKQTIVNAEAEKEEYIVFVRSFGCNPFLQFLFEKQDDLKFLKKCIVWGPYSYHKWFEVTDGLVTTELNEFGVKISNDFFNTIYPIEVSINKIKNSFPIIITSGTDDADYPIEFHNYLSSINRNNNIFFSNLIKGVAHVVEEKNVEYFELIFG